MRHKINLCLMVTFLALVAQGDDGGADLNYPMEAYLKASNNGSNDNFGSSVALAGNLMIIGSPLESSSVGGIDPGGMNDSLLYSGAAYIYRNGPNGWEQESMIKASTPVSFGNFGQSVGISGDRVIVGSPGHMGTGAVFVFRYMDNAWTQEAIIIPSDAEQGDFFGYDSAMSGDHIVVGAPGEDSGSLEDPSADPLTSCCVSSSGSAYTFQLDHSSGQWMQTAKLKSGSIQRSGGFGFSVDISGKNLIVGASNQNSVFDWDETQIYDPPQNGIPNSGAAYIFELVDGTWRQSAFLRGDQSFAESQFGEAVSIEGNVVAVGAPRETVNITDNNGNTMPFLSTGAVYIFIRRGDAWVQEFILNAGNPQGGDFFGSSVDLHGSRLLVGAPGEDGGSQWGSQPLNPDDNTVRDAGAAYLYSRTREGWQLQAYLKAFAPGREDNYGLSLGLSGSYMVIGSPKEDGIPSALIPTTDINSSLNSGAAYLYSMGSQSTTGIQISGNSLTVTPGESNPEMLNGTDFGKVSPGSSTSHIFLVHNYTGNTAVLNDVFLENSVFSVVRPAELPVGIPPGEVIELEVAFSPESSGKVEESSMRLNFDHSSTSVLEIRVQGYPNPVSMDLPGTDRIFNIPETSTSALPGRSLAASDAIIAAGAFRSDLDGEVIDSGAVYVMEASGDVWSEFVKIPPPEAQSQGYFGYDVGVEGDSTLIVGTPGWTSGIRSGAVMIYHKLESQWILEETLTPGVSDSQDSFGASVDISGDFLIVGAPDEDSQAVNVNGDSADNSMENSGAAYIFSKQGDEWVQEAYLKSGISDPFDGFGWTTAIDGDLAVVGAPYESSSANTVNGNQFNNILFGAGAAYIFRRTDDGWQPEAYLKPFNPGSQDNFGWSVDIDGNRVVVGAPNEDSDGLDPFNNRMTDSGAIYIFELIGNEWEQTAYLKGSEAHERYGYGTWVSVSGDKVATGAHSDRSVAPGLNLMLRNSDAPESGAVYVFEKTGESWVQSYYIKHSAPAPFDRFGWATVLTSNFIAVSALNKSVSAVTGSADRSGQLSIYNLGTLPLFLPENLQKIRITGDTISINGEYGRSYRIDTSEDLKEWNLFRTGRASGFNISVPIGETGTTDKPAAFFRMTDAAGE